MPPLPTQQSSAAIYPFQIRGQPLAPTDQPTNGAVGNPDRSVSSFLSGRYEHGASQQSYMDDTLVTRPVASVPSQISSERHRGASSSSSVAVVRGPGHGMGTAGQQQALSRALTELAMVDLDADEFDRLFGYEPSNFYEEQEALLRSLANEHTSGTDTIGLSKEEIANDTSTFTYWRTPGDDDQCAICLESFDDADELRTLRCGHYFHVTCIDEWFSRSKQCVTCRQSVAACEG